MAMGRARSTAFQNDCFEAMTILLCLEMAPHTWIASLSFVPKTVMTTKLAPGNVFRADPAMSRGFRSDDRRIDVRGGN